uniref:Uncharacterized protein n=1 Tax=Cannabis sativa TaxID=3483 RepID=A0A803NU79_CANSA
MAETVSSSSSSPPVVLAESKHHFGLQRFLFNPKCWKRLRCCFPICLGMPLTSDHDHGDQDEDHAKKSVRRRVGSKKSKKKKREENKNLSCVTINTNKYSSLQEREENIKVVIRYCKDTLSSTPSSSSSTTLSQG